MLHLLRMSNISATCTEHSIVAFFASPQTGYPVDVFLGTDGVIIVSTATFRSAFVLMQNAEKKRLALMKNGCLLNYVKVEVQSYNAFSAMYLDCLFLRKTGDDGDERKLIIRNFPSISKKEVIEFLHPYSMFVNENYLMLHYTECGKPVFICSFMSEIAALFAYFKKNLTIFSGSGKFGQIQLQYFYTYYSAFPICELSSAEEWEERTDIKVKKLIDYSKTRQWGIVTLNNLPFDMTLKEIQSIMAVQVPGEYITVFQSSRTSVNARIYFQNPEDAKNATHNIRTLTIGSNFVTIDIRIVKNFS